MDDGAVPVADFVESLRPCLGAVLESAELRHAPRPQNDELDWYEFVFAFSSDAPRFISWSQTPEDWELSSKSESHLRPDAVHAISGEEYPLIGACLGTRLNRFSLYSNLPGHATAALFELASTAFALSVGHTKWVESERRSELVDFGGDDLLLWTKKRFLESLECHPLSVVAELAAV